MEVRDKIWEEFKQATVTVIYNDNCVFICL